MNVIVYTTNDSLKFARVGFDSKQRARRSMNNNNNNNNNRQVVCECGSDTDVRGVIDPYMVQIKKLANLF